jgi:hypothetical protein
MIVRMSAAEITPGSGGDIGVQAFFQTDNFQQFQGTENGAPRSLPIDGQFYNLTFSLIGLTNMNVVDQTGINLGGHATDLRINVDSITFAIPEPGSLTLFAIALGAYACIGRCSRRGRIDV